MLRQSRKKILMFLTLSCAIPLGLNVFKNLSTRHTRQVDQHTLDRREGPPVFLISNSRTHTFLLKERSFIDENDKKHTENTNSTEQENRAGTPLDKIHTTVTETRTTAHVAAGSDQNTRNGSVVPLVTNWCPDMPPFLEGALADMVQDVSPKELIEWYPNMEKGGRLRPKECTPRQRLAIVIPYRNRFPHLHIMMNNLIPILQRQQADVTFFVIEQDLPGTFNRGALLNIGFLEAEKFASFDCYIFHDVDMVPLNDHNFYRCGDNPRHFAVAMNKFSYKLYYPSYFGAVVGFSKKQYLTVNGCSNIYFGWGGEDDDLLSRLRNKNYTMARYDPITARYDMIKHKRDEGNEENPLRRALRKDSLRRQDVEGLNTIKYKVNGIRLEHLYTWINVSLNETEILQAAPAFTLDVMRIEMNKLKAHKQVKTHKNVKKH